MSVIALPFSSKAIDALICVCPSYRINHFHCCVLWLDFLVYASISILFRTFNRHIPFSCCTNRKGHMCVSYILQIPTNKRFQLQMWCFSYLFCVCKIAYNTILFAQNSMTPSFHFIFLFSLPPFPTNYTKTPFTFFTCLFNSANHCYYLFGQLTIHSYNNNICLPNEILCNVLNKCG